MKYIYEYDSLFHCKVVVSEGECLVCKHCTDMWYDYSNGPYMVLCDIIMKTKLGNEPLSNFKKYGVPCKRYIYDGIKREVINGEA